MNSSNSSQPPSSDGLKKPAASPDRRSCPEKKGGQKGHQGKTLLQSKNPDYRVVHPVLSCEKCHADLSQQEPESYCKRQVFDAQIELVVTEHPAEKKTCSCGVLNRASFPKGVSGPVQMGNTIRSVSVLLAQHCISQERISEI